ncbi:MAG: MlaD family protein, partial [Bacteroidales bacterium]|nr:MlaD family protein [Bacteroidales bacterium]
MSRKIFKTQEIKIAVLAIVSLALIVWGINFLKGKNIFKKQFIYYGIFEEAGGLTPANTVYINGVNVGIVDKIALFGNDNEKVIVTFTVNKKIKIPSDTKIRIVSPGIVGSMQLECVLGDASTYFTNGDTLQGYVQPGMLANVDNIKNNLDTIIRSLKDMIQEGSLQASLQNINSTTDKLDSNMYSGQIQNNL